MKPSAETQARDAAALEQNLPASEATVWAMESAQRPCALQTADTDGAQLADDADTQLLSPSVRRLARQYDIDVTGIRGTGPSGRIRVSDVMGLLGGRAQPAEEPRPSSAAPTVTAAQASHATAAPDDSTSRAAPTQIVPITTLFECDMTAVLSHRKKHEQAGRPILLSSYFVIACLEAARDVPEVTAAPESLRLELHRCAPDGASQVTMLEPGAPELSVDAIDALLTLDDGRQVAVDRVGTSNGGRHAPADRDGTSNDRATFVVYHHGLSGSVFTTATPIPAGLAASLGIGAVRKQVVVREGPNGEAAARIAPRCYVSLSFDSRRLDWQRANRFLARLVQALEHWPED